MKLVSRDGAFDDRILGITYTGARRPVEALGRVLHLATVEMLKAIANPEKDDFPYSYERLAEQYGRAQNLGLLNLENNFTALLIGAKLVYEVTLCSDLGLTITQIADDESFMMGSGAPYMRDLDRRNEGVAIPIRMMHYAILMEPSCGGRILQFERLEDQKHVSGKTLVLTGLYDEPTAMLLHVAEIASQYELEPDLTLNANGYAAKHRMTGDNASAAVGFDDTDAEAKAKSDQQAARAEAARADAASVTSKRTSKANPVRKPAIKPTKRKRK